MALKRQEIFSAAYLGLRNQGFRRSVGADSCQYRGKEGRKCALGHLIPDDHYDPMMEGRGPSSKEIKAAIEEAGFGTYIPWMLHRERRILRERNEITDLDFLKFLQIIHDESIECDGETEPEIMEGGLKEFAEKWNLTIPE